MGIARVGVEMRDYYDILRICQEGTKAPEPGEDIDGLLATWHALMCYAVDIGDLEFADQIERQHLRLSGIKMGLHL